MVSWVRSLAVADSLPCVKEIRARIDRSWVGHLFASHSRSVPWNEVLFFGQEIPSPQANGKGSSRELFEFDQLYERGMQEPLPFFPGFPV